MAEISELFLDPLHPSTVSHAPITFANPVAASEIPIHMPSAVGMDSISVAIDSDSLFSSMLPFCGPSSPTNSLFSDASSPTAAAAIVSQCPLISTFGPEHINTQMAHLLSTPSPAAESFSLPSPSPSSLPHGITSQPTAPPLVSPRPRRTKWESLVDGGGPAFFARPLADNVRVFRRVVDPSTASTDSAIQVAYTFQVQARMDKGFHRTRGLPTAYRRNQTEILACFTAVPAESSMLIDAAFTLPCLVQLGSREYECAFFKIHPTVVRTGTEIPIDLLHATRARTRGAMAAVDPVSCEPNGWLDVPSIEYLTRRAHFPGVMFASATPDTASRPRDKDNGMHAKTKRQRKQSTKAKLGDSQGVSGASPATFTVIVDVVAYTESGDRIGVVASCESDPIVVRSRPPSHYVDEDRRAERTTSE